MTPQAPVPITQRRPVLERERLLQELVPPSHFARASFSNYRPDPAHTSQAEARERLSVLSHDLWEVKNARKGWLRRKPSAAPRAMYLDGGFGVGKTHLLASLAHEVGPALSAYGTFVEFTNLVGALGFAPTVQALSVYRVVCIDEFELDDPGDTLMMARLLRELDDAGVSVVATSNTLPESLGEGRFAAEDFLREIQALAQRFEVVRIDGPDYRHRSTTTEAAGLPDDFVERAVADNPRAVVESFDNLLKHLATVHPSRYTALVEGISLLGITNVHTIDNEALGLRFVVLVDRLYDRDIPLLLGGTGTNDLFTPQMLRGGYRKKYLRALSRIGSLWTQGAALCGPPNADG